MIKRTGHFIIDVPQCIGERARIYCTTEPHKVVPTEKIAELRMKRLTNIIKNNQEISKASAKIQKSLVNIL